MNTFDRIKDFLGIETEAPGPECDVTIGIANADGLAATDGRSTYLLDEEKPAAQEADYFHAAREPLDASSRLLGVDFDEAAEAVVEVELYFVNNLSDTMRDAAEAVSNLATLLLTLPPDEPKTYNGPLAFYPHYESIILRDAFPEKDFDRILWVAQQDRIWVDAWGHLHDLDLMPLDYKLNILSLLHEWIGQGILPVNPYDCPLIQRLRADLLGD